MKVVISPSKNNQTPIDIPSSKSLLHRDLILAAMAKGVSVIHNVTLNDDVKATIRCLENLNVKINYHKNTLTIDSTSKLKIINNHFYPKESGSTLRFMIPIIGQFSEKCIFHLEGKLGTRPMDEYEKIFKENDCTFYYQNNSELVIQGPLKLKKYHLKGNITSQYISGLLMASTIIEDDVTIEVEKEIESVPYINLTIGELNKFGIKIEQIETFNSVIYQKKKNQKLKCQNMVVEGDYSQAAFFIALGLINQPTYINNLDDKSLQGDKKIISFIERLGGKVIKENNLIKSEFANLPKDIVTIDIKDTPDLGPILMAISSILPLTTKLINTRRLIYKESNRSISMQEELKKIGSVIKVDENEIIITGLKKIPETKKIFFDSHNDHRIVMSLAIIATIFKTDVEIINVEAINKSYPTFFDDLKKLGIKIKMEKNNE